MVNFLDFEKPIAELQGKIEEMRRLEDSEALNIADELQRLEAKVEKELKAIYAKLTPWQRAQVARHPTRPHFLDYASAMVEDFTPLAGDRLFGEDAAIQGGPARFRGHSVMLIGQEKGADTASRVKHNFGMARPEGYRKAQRLMLLAERFGLPIVTLVDTAGAHPGREAEERGQAEAIARSIDIGLSVGVPYVSVVIGEGGSGGAIAIATAGHVFMLEHSIYSVISPEGCASILWRSDEQAKEAAEALKLTAQDLRELGVIDGVIPEPLGGAHRDHAATVGAVAEQIEGALDQQRRLSPEELRQQRRDKFIEMGREGLG